MNLNIYNTTNLFEAATNLFQQLNIKLNSNSAEPLPTKDILKHHYKDNDTFKAIDKTYFIGIIDDSVFKATGMFNINYSYKEAIEQGDKYYNGLMLFALELKKQDYKTLVHGLEEFPAALVNNAYTLLNSESLYRSEKCLGVATWLLEVHAQRAASRDERVRDNRTWLAVAGAPAGFCHVRSTMIGTLLEDLAAGLEIEAIRTRFAAKMHPLQYQRPTAAPSAGNISQAEKIIAAMKAAGSLERRFARLEDIRPLWTPAGAHAGKRGKAGAKGVFAEVKAKGRPSAQIEGPTVTMTWEKFLRTVLPTAEQIEYQVPTTSRCTSGW